MESNKFSLIDLYQVIELIYTIRKSTVPLNEHTDPLSVNDCWEELDYLINKFGTTFKDQLCTKESLEEMTGKTFHIFEKTYDENGVLREIKIQPVQALEYIDLNFTILPNSDK